MNKGMLYCFSQKVLWGILIVLSMGNSRAFAQNNVYMGLFQGEQFKQWSLDLGKLEPGASYYVLVTDSSDLSEWRELNGKTLTGLFDYALPRFSLKYDSFDCLERTLLADSDSGQDHVRGSGEIMGIPGTPVKRPAAARGQTDNITIRYLSGQELQGFARWLKPGSYVLEIRLNEDAKKEKRVLLFRQEAEVVPHCFTREEAGFVPLSVHLFSMDKNGRVLAANWNKRDGNMVLPPEVMRQRRAFQDTLIRHWQEAPQAVLVYSWDIGLSGGDKCIPCIAPPPDFSLLQDLGMDSMPEHLYVNYSIFSPESSRELALFPFESFQWIFEMNEPAKGFLNCEEAVLYREMVSRREELALKNLRGLLGDKAKLFEE